PWHRSFAYLDADENEPIADLLIDGASGPEAQVQARNDVELALASLAPLTRSVVWLYDVDGYTHGEIARLTGRTASFSKSQLARAHQRLRELLDHESETLPCTHLYTLCIASATGSPSMPRPRRTWSSARVARASCASCAR